MKNRALAAFAVVAASLALVGTALAIDRRQARAEAQAEMNSMVLGPGWTSGTVEHLAVTENGPGKPQWHAEFVKTRRGFNRTDWCAGRFDITAYGHVENRYINCVSKPTQN